VCVCVCVCVSGGVGGYAYKKVITSARVCTCIFIMCTSVVSAALHVHFHYAFWCSCKELDKECELMFYRYSEAVKRDAFKTSVMYGEMSTVPLDQLTAMVDKVRMCTCLFRVCCGSVCAILYM